VDLRRAAEKGVPGLTVFSEKTKRRHPVIIAMVTFKLPEPWTVAEAARAFASTAPNYLNRPGLIRKHYFLNEAGDRAGGIYLWASKTDALACYDAPWRTMVTEKYGEPPTLVFFESPVTVDNINGVIETR
jgi:hypothetical protein